MAVITEKRALLRYSRWAPSFMSRISLSAIWRRRWGAIARVVTRVPRTVFGKGRRFISQNILCKLGPTRVGAVEFGHLRRVRPISSSFGFDRGKPIDRRYIEDFLSRHAQDITGRVLEVADNAYTCAIRRNTCEAK